MSLLAVPRRWRAGGLRTAPSRASQNCWASCWSRCTCTTASRCGLARPVGPGAQQRRLPAAGRRRDDRDLARRRAVQRGEQDRPGRSAGELLRATVTGLPWYLRLTPCASVTQSWHLRLGTRPAPTVNGGERSAHCHTTPPRSIQPVNHRDR